jgi:putative radical SAM enzyme (TIGR03279 family)
MAARDRTDYAPTKPIGSAAGAIIAAVEPDSPAARAGLEPGMVVLSVDGEPLRDIVDWLWLTDGAEIRLEVVGKRRSQAGASDCEPMCPESGCKAARNDVDDASPELSFIVTRNIDETWGIAFEDPLFDGVMTCRNNCLFCFMNMLPNGLRQALYVRDDDYRLSFLQGNFVTLTNLTAADVERIIDMRLSPLHVSLHAVTPQVRERLIGRHQAWGLEALEQLLAAGIELHVQVVLVPGINDGGELDATLRWIEQRPGILSAGIVPYGYTRYARLQASYAEPQQAQAVLAQIEPYQRRTRQAHGVSLFQPSDEFYCNAYPLAIAEHLPPANYYDSYPQFEDGIGLLRAFTDEWQATIAGLTGEEHWPLASLVCGTAFARFFQPLLAASPLAGRLGLLPVENRFFGGNIDVSGLLTATDIIEQLGSRLKHGACKSRSRNQNPIRSARPSGQLQLNDASPGGISRELPIYSLPPISQPICPESAQPLGAITASSDLACLNTLGANRPQSERQAINWHLPGPLLLPQVMFNADGLTLDDCSVTDIAVRLGVPAIVVPCDAESLLKALKALPAQAPQKEHL